LVRYKYIYVVKQRIYERDFFIAVVHDVVMKATSIKKTQEEKNKVSVAVGARLKKLRIDAKKTQEELAFSSSVDKTFISAIERGAANPSVLTLANICFGLNITLEELFETLSVALEPNETLRRVNVAKVELKPKRPRLR
jgi:DNA-binding XRE family transcriptional regulator